MLDTIRLGTQVEGLTISELRGRGWAYNERATAERSDVWMTLKAEPGDVRLSYLAHIGWLSAEVSLPKLLLGDNAKLLDWEECCASLALLHSLTQEATGAHIAPVADFRVSRLDAVWAWGVEPSLYVDALRWSKLPRTEPRSYGGSVSWLTMQGGRIRGRCYDKSLEVGAPVELPLRLERQTRPRREVVRVRGRRLPGVVGELEAEDALGVVGDTMHALGLDAPVPGPQEARRLLVERYGARRGRNLYRALLEAQASGGCWPSDVPLRTRQRWEAELRRAGIRSLSWQGELPALELPRAEEPSGRASCVSST
jgi:hypothetical protein